MYVWIEVCDMFSSFSCTENENEVHENEEKKSHTSIHPYIYIVEKQGEVFQLSYFLEALDNYHSET